MYRRNKRKQCLGSICWVIILSMVLMFIHVFSAFSEEKGWGGDKLAKKTSSIINIDLKQAKESNPIKVSSSVTVIWEFDGTMVVQVYRKGNLIYPKSDPHEEHSSGVTIELNPGKHEIKVWIPETGKFKSTWVLVTD